MTHPHGHLDLEGLADVLAGERDDAHVRSCAACTDALAELAAADATVTAALTALPPPPLPPGLSLRLTRALQDERRRDVATLRPRRRRTPTWLPAAAASAVLVLAGAAGWSLLEPSVQGSSEDAAGDTSTASGGGGGQGGRAQDPASQPEAAAELAAPPAAVAPSATTSGVAPRTAATSTDWADPTARPLALSRLLDQATLLASPVPAAAPPGDGLDPLRDPAALSACLTALPGRQDEVLAVDYAQYAGAPAVAVVQPDGPGLVQVTVVGSGCSAADPQLLDRTVLTRP